MRKAPGLLSPGASFLCVLETAADVAPSAGGVNLALDGRPEILLAAELIPAKLLELSIVVQLPPSILVSLTEPPAFLMIRVFI